ncbi:hypothetical protein NPE20_15550 [Mucilaginibacter sp. JC4]|uniref:Secreted protein n=1 Tax=Mucilaginibacter aquariorum TaxID=2967225 RepID=A0ABT1T531_9SPHI|nr:hypothetical protein [Mucilaginibacter aquariorum]
MFNHPVIISASLIFGVPLLTGPLAAAEAPSFLLIEKKQKIKSAKRLLCRTMPLPCKPGKTTGWNLLPHCVRSLALASAKFPMPLQPHKTTIVLPAFARSCFADGEERKETLVPFF